MQIEVERVQIKPLFLYCLSPFLVTLTKNFYLSQIKSVLLLLEILWFSATSAMKSVFQRLKNFSFLIVTK